MSNNTLTTSEPSTNSTEETTNEDESMGEYERVPDSFESEIDTSEAQVPDYPVKVHVEGKGEAAARLMKQKTIEDLREQAQGGEVDAQGVTTKQIVRILKNHYVSPSFENLTVRKYNNGKAGYYDKFFDAINPELSGGN